MKCYNDKQKRNHYMIRRIPTRSSERGVAATIVTIAFALLFVTIVVGLTALSIREQRQAGDIDQSNRALAAAEAGIKDALSRLATDSGFRENCTGGRVGDAEWTCRVVSSTAGPVITTQNRDEGRMAWVYTGKDAVSGANSGVSNVNIKWAMMGTDDVVSGYSWGSLPGASLYPTYPPAWSGPAALEVTVVYWKRAPAPAAGESVDSGWLTSVGGVMPSKTFLIWPHGGDHSPISGHSAFSATTNCGMSSPANTEGYYCTTGDVNLGSALNISSPEDYGMVFKFRPRYRGTHVRADFTNGSSKVDIQNTAITIDVTARSGNIYKRLIAEKSLESSARDNIFDSAIYSGSTDGICKNMKVAADYSLIDPNNCP